MNTEEIHLSDIQPTDVPLTWWDAMVVNDILVPDEADSQPLNALHVLNLAESIAAFGLLEPLVVNAAGRLLVGWHRLAAMQLLTLDDGYDRVEIFSSCLGEDLPDLLADRVQRLNSGEFLFRYPHARIPVLVLDLPDGADGSLIMKAVEAAVRQQYRTDISRIFQNAGFVSRNRIQVGDKQPKGKGAIDLEAGA
jgi:ParB-like chromosome segregation protein Spo0J